MHKYHVLCTGIPQKGGGGGTNNATPPRTPTMSGFEIPTGPSIAENKLTYRVHKWKTNGRYATPKPSTEALHMITRKGG